MSLGRDEIESIDIKVQLIIGDPQKKLLGRQINGKVFSFPFLLETFVKPWHFSSIKIPSVEFCLF